MKVTKEKTENNQAFLTIEMEPAEVEASLEESYRRLVKKANIPGFRRGKAPRAILERYVGKEGLLEDALNYLVPQAYEKALKEQELKAIAQPQIEVTQTEPVIFKATVPLPPVVKLGDYQSIRMEPEKVEIKDEDVEKAIDQLRHSYATWEPVERSINFDDLAVIDVESQVEGKPFISQKGAQYQVIKELSLPAPGFANELVGMKKDDEKEFKLQLPSDYYRKELAGKEANFKVKVIEIKQEILPELNDEFAKQVDAEFQTLATLRERLADNLKLRAEETAKASFEGKVLEAVVIGAQVEYPPVLLELEVDHLIEDQARQLQREGTDLETYLKNAKKTSKQLHEELHPVAAKRVIRSLVLGKVADEEKVEVTGAEIDAEIENMLKGATQNKEELQKMFNAESSRDSIRQFLLTRKTMNRLVEIAKSPEKKEEVAK